MADDIKRLAARQRQRSHYPASLSHSCASCSLILAGVLSLTASAAEWSAEKKEAVTEYMQQYRRAWSLQDTEALARGSVPHSQYSVSIEGRAINQRIIADDGRRIPVEVFGQSVLVDGKDLSGNLGSKTTYGTNSPIIEGVRNSQVTTGNSSSITATTSNTSNTTINVSLSIALTLSVAGNLYLWRRLRRKDRDTEGAAGGKAA
jgi:hypothetical protein